jgi:cytochrome c peroxidase
MARNIRLTAPYFHSGQAWDLGQAVVVMDTSQVGTQLSNDEVQKITAFLDGLTGDQPKVTYPVLPPSIGSTPQPQP